MLKLHQSIIYMKLQINLITYNYSDTYIHTRVRKNNYLGLAFGGRRVVVNPTGIGVVAIGGFTRLLPSKLFLS